MFYDDVRARTQRCILCITLVYCAALCGCDDSANQYGVRQYVIKDGPVAAELTFPAGFNVKIGPGFESIL